MSHIDNPNDEMEERDEDRYQAAIAMREAEARGETAALFRTDGDSPVDALFRLERIGAQILSCWSSGYIVENHAAIAEDGQVSLVVGKLMNDLLNELLRVDEILTPLESEEDSQ